MDVRIADRGFVIDALPRGPVIELRQAPPSSTPNQTCAPSAGSTQMVRMRGRLTPRQNSGISGGNRSQVSPPSTDRNMTAREGAPVPA